MKVNAHRGRCRRHEHRLGGGLSQNGFPLRTHPRGRKAGLAVPSTSPSGIWLVSSRKQAGSGVPSRWPPCARPWWVHTVTGCSCQPSCSDGCANLQCRCLSAHSAWRRSDSSERRSPQSRYLGRTGTPEIKQKTMIVLLDFLVLIQWL